MRSLPRPRVTLPGTHSLWAVGVANVFQMLRVGAAISDGSLWRAIHVEPGVGEFELEHGIELERNRYNARCFARVRRSKRPVLGQYAGFCDWFVPVVLSGQVEAILVTGPFATERPTAASILARWRALTGGQGHVSDPEFAHYAAVTLSTLVLTKAQVASFGRLVSLLTRLMSGEQPARPLLDRIDVLWEDLETARLAERVWDAAREMIDERTTHRWARPHELRGRRFFGLPAMPTQALVALAVSPRPDLDPVDALVRREMFQRNCVALARRSGHAIAGRVGDHGVVFLSVASGRTRQRRRRLVDLADRAREAAERLGFRLHVGLGVSSDGASLPAQFQAALAAAEKALSEGVWLIDEPAAAARAGLSLGSLRTRLAKLMEERPAEIGVRFDHYLDLVASVSGYRIDLARVHAEAGFERVLESIAASGALDAKSLGDLTRTLDLSSREARTIADLFSAYRRAIADVAAAFEQPVSARRDRSLRRALDYVHEHYAEPLRLAKVARVAGFARNYFSSLFKAREKMSFADYVRKLRVERAQHLLATTDLSTDRVARLSGLGTRQYMARALKQAAGVTPSECRRRQQV